MSYQESMTSVHAQTASALMVTWHMAWEDNELTLGERHDLYLLIQELVEGAEFVDLVDRYHAQLSRIPHSTPNRHLRDKVADVLALMERFAEEREAAQSADTERAA